MKIANLTLDLVPGVKELMALGRPYISVRTDSDYWLYAQLFSTSCLVALDHLAVPRAAIIAFRSQDDPNDIYVQDVVTHPQARRAGLATVLLEELTDVATCWQCQRLWLTSEPENEPAHATWISLGFVNVPGNRQVNGIAVIDDFKGPGKHRSIYERSV